MNDELERKKYFYICEGISDEDKLKKIGCLFVLPVGGEYIRKEILNYLKIVNEHRKIVLVLDPDGPGRRIEKKLTEYIHDFAVVKIEKKKAIKNEKVGVAQMKMDDLKEAIRPYIFHDLSIEENDSIDDEELFELDLIGGKSSFNKQKLIKTYSIPFKSTKKVCEALRVLSLSYKDVKMVLKDE